MPAARLHVKMEEFYACDLICLFVYVFQHLHLKSVTQPNYENIQQILNTGLIRNGTGISVNDIVAGKWVRKKNVDKERLKYIEKASNIVYHEVSLSIKSAL